MLPIYQARSPFVLKHTTSWRASVASETLTEVTQSKIGDVCLFSERAKRAKLTLSRVQLRFQIYIYRYVYVRQKISPALLIT